MLPIKEIYKAIEDIPYVIMRLPKDWPKYKVGSDVDIITTGLEDMVDALRAVSTKYDCPYSVFPGSHYFQRHADFMKGNKIELRFDIYDSVPYDWQKPAAEIIDEGLSFEREGIATCLPNVPDEIIIRLLEYEKHPEKKQHLDWIKANL